MRFLDLARRRCSIRGYKSDPVPADLLEQVLQTGNLAPSAKNLQPFHFIVVTRQDQRDELAKAYPAPFFRQAPVVIVICVEPAKGWVRERYDGKNYCEIDAAIAIDHMTLAAADLGLGTCWIGAFDPGQVREAMKLPDGIEPIAMLPLGYPDDEGRPKRRKQLSELVHRETW